MDLCVKHLETILTSRGTLVEFFEDPKYGIVCSMNGLVQSTTSDEKIYHNFFTNLGLSSAFRTDISALIIGSGEGCLARDLLTDTRIKHITMVDWDKDVVDKFQSSSYVEKWAGKSTWQDSRLNVEIADAWQWTEQAKSQFDIIFIDLFDPENTLDGLEKWENLLVQTKKLLNKGGTLVVYCGIDKEDVYQETELFLNFGEFWRGIEISGGNSHFNKITKHYLNVTSFEGDAVFLRASGYFAT